MSLNVKNENQNGSAGANEKICSVYIYDLLGTIGHGNFSVCKLAQHKISNQKFAIKCIEKRSLDNAQLSRIYREIEIMKSLEHPNIIKLNQVIFKREIISKIEIKNYFKF